MSIDFSKIAVSEITDTLGGCKILSARFGRHFSEDSLRQLVKRGKLRAFVFKHGDLVEREPNEDTQGKDLILLRSDLERLPKPQVGRPRLK